MPWFGRKKKSQDEAALDFTVEYLKRPLISPAELYPLVKHPIELAAMFEPLEIRLLFRKNAYDLQDLSVFLENWRRVFPKFQSDYAALYQALQELNAVQLDRSEKDLIDVQLDATKWLSAFCNYANYDALRFQSYLNGKNREYAERVRVVEEAQGAAADWGQALLVDINIPQRTHPKHYAAFEDVVTYLESVNRMMSKTQ